MLDTSPAIGAAKLVRQVLGAISEFDKAMTVAKLRGARERKRRDVGKCEGRKSHAERKIGRPGPSTASQEAEGRSTLTA